MVETRTCPTSMTTADFFSAGLIEGDREKGMRSCLANGLALMATLALTACSGGNDPGSGRTPDLGEIRELAGLSAPAESVEEAQARGLDIFARADSLILSTMHGETGSAEVPAFLLLTQCGGARCTVTEPLSGAVDTIELANTPLRQGAATAIGTKHGITLTQESSTHTGADLSSLGAWMEHGSFAILNERQTGEDGTVDVWYGIALGDASRIRAIPPGMPALPVGSATWLGIMTGTPVAGEARGERLVGDAVLTWDPSSGDDRSGHSLDVAFGGIRNIDRGTAHTVGTMVFSDLAVARDGSFARGDAGGRIQGGLFGADHAEAAGIFEQSGIVGAFGAKRQ